MEKEKIRKIISEMTLEEKAGLCSGADTWRLKAVERLGISSVMVSDGPHGLRKQEGRTDHLGLNESVKAVCFPAACALASSFDTGLAEKTGGKLGEECRAEDVAVLLGPAVNIKRSPLCGRNFEYFSEDPFLAGKMATAQIRGIQKWDVGTSLKHFAANNQEHCRMTCSSNLSERTLREIYLTAFEIAVKEAKPWSIMCSYNKLNGVFASENKKLLTDILRDEWGFEGFVVSDWGAVNDRVDGLEAGLDLEMPSSGGEQDARIVAAVREGRIAEEVVDTAVERILDRVFEYVEHEHPEAVFDRAAHHAAAAEAEKECAVLLKNNGVLPLNREQKIVYIGEFAEIPRYQGGGSSHINPWSVKGALAAAEGKNEVIYAKGFPNDSGSAPEEEMEAAADAAGKADVAVIFAGLPDSYESEGYDRSHLRLPDCQNRLIERICRVQDNVVVVLHNGSPVELPWADQVSAILEMYLGGEGVGEAADALLYGEANPSGRLPETFPMCLEHTPAFLNFPGDGENVDYQEGVFVGYRYYETKKLPVRYPFGHGLSYTEFEYTGMRLSADSISPGQKLTVQVDVKNTGKRSGSEAVQIYVSDRTGTPGRPVKELKGFEKVSLAPGETKTVEITLDERAFQWYYEGMGKWYAKSGVYAVCAAHSSADVRLVAEVNYESGCVPLLKADKNTTIMQLLEHPATKAATAQMLSAFKSHIPQSRDGSEANSISSAMMREMVFNAPLRALANFKLIDGTEMEKLILQFNTLLSGGK